MARFAFPPRSTRLPIAQKVRCFCTNDAGNVTIYSIFIVLLVLMITGASVDLMRQEASRVRLQTTLDRAVLAAADLDQAQDPLDVVNDYLTKADLQSYVSSIDVDTGLNERTVGVQAGASLATLFLKMMGRDTLDTGVVSVAQERISNVEISLVLDVSGSMRGSRIDNLKAAAKEFIDTVIVPTEEGGGLTTVSLVPYNATVNLGDTVSGYWTLDAFQTYSSCPIFEAHEFDETAIHPTDTLARLAHFDLYATDKNATGITRPWCRTGHENAVIMHSSDKTALKSHIDTFDADGNTAIDLGVKWGAALLDPAARPAVSALAADGLVVPDAAQRPAEFDDAEAIKFIVVMTDGANTTEYDLKSSLKFGMSDVWIDDRGTASKSDDRFSVLVKDNSGDNNDIWFWPRYEGSSWNSRNRNTPDGGAGARRMSNPELYARFGVKAVAQKFYTKPYYDGFISQGTYYDYYYGYQSIVNSAQADARLADICAAAKEAGVVVFSIAFEAPEAGQAALRGCASSLAHYFDVEGVEITDTFHSIARQINNLRLIQ